MSDVCAFCEPSGFAERIVCSNEHAIGLLSSPRLSPGHSLVIPRRHVESFDELNVQEVQAIHELISQIYRRLLETVASGVDVWQKTRHRVAQDGFKMNHIHFHVIPSMPQDERYIEVLRWSRDQFEILRDEERAQMLELLQGPKNRNLA